MAESRSPEKAVLIEHRLGCRVIKTCLNHLLGEEITAKEVHLLSAAVPAGELWEGFLTPIAN
ncbi:MAG: hypothetical protein V1789_10370 [PVC group bacterium]